jgi:hypothetical protein
VAVLGLVGEGVEQPEQLARLLAIPSRRLQPFIAEFLGRGMLRSASDGRLSLSETGKLCTLHGRAVIDVLRAVLLCGLSGRLMPSAAYKVRRQGAGELARSGRWHMLMHEAARIPLGGLDLRGVSDKAALNLSDETEAIMSIEGEHRPAFLPCFLVVQRPPSGTREQIDAYFPDACLEDLPRDAVLPFLEPLGFDDGLSLPEAHARVCAALERAGAALLDEGELDVFGNPRFSLRGAGDAFLTRFVHGRPLAYYLGTSRQPPLPIGELRSTEPSRRGERETRTVDVLGGHALFLSIEDGPAAFDAQILRRAHDVLDSRPRPHELFGRLREALQGLGTLAEAAAVAKRLDDRILQRVLASD